MNQRPSCMQKKHLSTGPWPSIKAVGVSRPQGRVIHFSVSRDTGHSKRRAPLKIEIKEESMDTLNTDFQTAVLFCYYRLTQLPIWNDRSKQPPPASKGWLRSVLRYGQLGTKCMLCSSAGIQSSRCSLGRLLSGGGGKAGGSNHHSLYFQDTFSTGMPFILGKRSTCSVLKYLSTKCEVRRISPHLRDRAGGKQEQLGRGR